MSTFKNKLLYPILAAVIAGLILFWLKNEIPNWPNITIKIGTEGTSIVPENSIASDNEKEKTFTTKVKPKRPTRATTANASASWPSAVKKLVDDMETIQGGLFQMGCTSEQKDCDDNESPAHWVRLSDYQIGKYEVTQAQWKAVMSSNKAHFKGCDRCPMENVSWNDVQLFINELNRITGKKFRLPTEAEWEFAARGGVKNKETLYAGSNDIDRVAWYDGNSGNKTHIVGQKAPNELGLYDMSGNVYEWCSDWYGRYRKKIPGVVFETKPQKNPRGVRRGSYRVFRGGSWNYDPRNCRVSSRNSSYFGNSDNGFRLSHSL